MNSLDFYNEQHKKIMRRVDTKPCVLCEEDCEPAPNNHGWIQFGHQRMHFDCVDRLKATVDELRSQIAEEK